MTHPLARITIASPCHADWNEMQGNEQVRFCKQCQLNVYNLSGMSRTDAEHLVASQEGRLCVRFYQRNDGTVITQNCPVGLQALHRRKVTRWGATAAVLTLITVAGAFIVTAEAKRPSTRQGESGNVIKVENRVPSNATMGDVATPMMGAPAVQPVQGLMARPEAVQGNMVKIDVKAKPPKHPVKPCKLPKQPKAPKQSGQTPAEIFPPQTSAIMGKIAAPSNLTAQPIGPSNDKADDAAGPQKPRK